MLELTIPKQSLFNNDTQEFVEIKETKLKLEHSLLSLKKWESRWHKPFLVDAEKTLPEIIDYIYCMSLDRNVDQEIYKYLTNENISRVVEYIKNPMTATTFSGNTLVGAQRYSKETITAEIIYYWMVALRIPVEFEKWHLNQLLTLIKVVNIKNGGDKKMSPKEAAAQRKALNAKRRAKYNTKG